MAALESEITVKMEMRPCMVKGRKALFHRWVDRSECIEPSPLIGGHNGGVAAWTDALVEYEDGTVAEVAPRYIKFLDPPHGEFDFSEREGQA